MLVQFRITKSKKKTWWLYNPQDQTTEQKERLYNNDFLNILGESKPIKAVEISELTSFEYLLELP